MNSSEFIFSVIIPTFNRRDIIEQTLFALEAQTMDKELFEVIIVDDGSTDDTADFLERYKNRAHLHFTYLSKKNEGQGIARNTGFDVSEGKYVLFLGDDHIPLPDLLEEHRRVHDKFKTENFVCLGHTTWHPDLEVNDYMRFLEDVGAQFKYKALDKAKLVDPTLGLRLANHKFFYTGNISLKRSLFKKHRFDENFKKYGWEDIELGFRLEREEGAVILYNPQARALHYHQQEESEMEKKFIQIGKNAVRAEKVNKHFKIVPGFFKRMAFRLISNPLSVGIIKKFIHPHPAAHENKLQFWKKLYYYALMKRYYLRGIKQGRRLKS